ncbi:sugar transferase [Caballeronia sordidicola]|uniref:sugar transferase n=1 Tax=Caballeronia sordidicola TaxID=196367 RepID=UPI001F33308F|nr:sugar transferase [Caballeronia sordidicola]
MKVLMEKRAMSRHLMPASIPAAHSRELSVSRGDSLPDSTTCLDAASTDASLDVSANQGFQSDESNAGGMDLSLTTRNVVKRTIDIVGASSLLIAMSPFLLIMGAIVMSDGGRPVFGHVRIGRNGRKFRCLKFRSMVTGADAVLKHLLATDPKAREEWDRDFKLKNDIRITPIGRLLRRTSLDELPQLWNVLRGDMSLVGPRPIVDEELARYGADVHYYLETKPGMTGLWQVSGRNDVDYATRVSLDVSYAKDCSLSLDILILLKTFKVIFKRDGAY